MPTKDQVEEYIKDAKTVYRQGFVKPPPWYATIDKHLREWVAEYDEENEEPE